MDVVTIYQERADPVDNARFGIQLSGRTVTPNTRFRFRLLPQSIAGLYWPIFTVEENPPFVVDVWDWWQYLNIRLEREYGLAVTGKKEQSRLDLRFDIKSRPPAEFVFIVDVEWEPDYTDEIPDRERIYALIDGVLQRPYSGQFPVPDIVGFPRKVNDGRRRVIADGRERFVFLPSDEVLEAARRNP